MKRKGEDESIGIEKKQRTAVKEVKEADSIYDQAAPYLLATARFPIDALTAEWSLGVNRPIDEAHKRRLRQIFDEAGVLRRDTSHRLQVACSKAQVQQMLDHLEEEGQAQTTVTAAEGAEEGDSKWPSFEGWESVIGEKAELIAGHHRVEAFKEHLRLRQSPEEERWWVCSIYDKDTLPPRLRIQLRANREDIILPDNHGQIWTELATLSLNNGQLFQGSNKTVEQEMLEQLRLSSRVRFPVRRLATLWKNLSWRPMITRWCRTSIGQMTFNISTFEWMASCRIDDYWFSAFNEVMKIASEIQDQHGLDNVQLADWNKLASLPRVRSVHEVQGLFYPGLEPDVEPRPSGTRRRDFFPNISDDAYFNLYQSVLSEPGRRFIDIQALLKTTKQEGKLMSIIMSHVSQWMNKEPEKVSDRDNNKPALRKDLVPALRAKYGDKADDMSQVLQQSVLDHVRENAKDFTSATLERYLHEYPGGDGDTYGARFKHEVWRNVLSIVTNFAGPTLQHKYMASLNLEGTHKISPLMIAQTARDLICQIPDVANDPALRSTSAVKQLLKMLQPVIAQWISEQGADASDYHSNDRQPSTAHPAEVQYAKTEALFQVQDRVSAARRKRELPWIQEGSRTHGSIKEPGIAKSPTNGPKAASDTGASALTELQERGLIDFTADRLDSLRRQHCHKSVASQQRAQVHRASPVTDSHQPADSERFLSARATTSSGHWRQLASSKRGRKQS